MHEIDLEGVPIELRVDESLIPSVLRALAGRTNQDREVDQLSIPLRPLPLRVGILVLRWYRRLRPAWMGQRCVWDPSCSRYAELAVRKSGLVSGIVATLSRLRRCRPGRGGVDVP